MAPHNGRVQIQFPEKSEGPAGDAERENAKQDEARGRRRGALRVKDEAGGEREME